MAILGVHKIPLVTRWAIKHKVTSLNDKLTADEKQKRGEKHDGWN